MDLDYRNNCSCSDTLFYIFLEFYALKFKKKFTLIQHAKKRAIKVQNFSFQVLSSISHDQALGSW